MINKKNYSVTHNLQLFRETEIEIRGNWKKKFFSPNEKNEQKTFQ